MIISSAGQNIPKKRAVFMDRDGVLNVSKKPDGSYLPVNKPEDLVVTQEAKDGLAKLTKETDFLKVLVTNQGGIGAGYMKEEELKAIHDKLLTEIRNAGGDIDAIYYAVSNDKNDQMRKPNPGMLLKAAEDLNIDLTHSYMIGDMTTDISAGEKADSAVTSILVETGEGGKDKKVDIKPDVVTKNISTAADYIIVDYKSK